MINSPAHSRNARRGGKLVFALALLASISSQPALAYKPVKDGETQSWYEDAKFGIFIHWGIYSVPGYAPVENAPNVNRTLLEELWLIIKNGGETETPYAEWYKSNLSKSGETTERFHQEHYGEGFDYYDFAPMFNDSISQWRPREWAQTFREVGAQYVVLVSKHHDGFTLWPSAYPSTHIPKGKGTATRNIVDIIKNYREKVPHGVINNRWRDVPRSQVKPDFGTPEYTTHEERQSFKWETSRGLGYSYGYNRMDNEGTTLTRKELIHFLIDVVSKNGNLLLNIGPKADGSIPDIQLDRLRALGQWLAVNGEAIYDTRPWRRAEGETGDGISIRFTQKEDGRRLFAILLEKPDSGELLIRDIEMPTDSTLSLLGSASLLGWTQQGKDIVVQWPDDTADSHAYILDFRKQ